ncbi:hypothetical protein C8F01DRAFT_1293092 [Mycena amicta]|nr:hypothetical protein C8F01DRAFT_1293092 [Mycena amicta]
MQAPLVPPIWVPPRVGDGPGWFYKHVIIAADQPIPVAHRILAKLGSTKNLRRRMCEHQHHCRGQVQRWIFAYFVPQRYRFERIIHLYYKIHRRTWLGPRKCEFCVSHHREHFDLVHSGGILGMQKVIEAYILQQGWPIRRLVALRRVRAASALSPAYRSCESEDFDASPTSPACRMEPGICRTQAGLSYDIPRFPSYQPQVTRADLTTTSDEAGGPRDLTVKRSSSSYSARSDTTPFARTTRIPHRRSRTPTRAPTRMSTRHTPSYGLDHNDAGQVGMDLGRVVGRREKDSLGGTWCNGGLGAMADLVQWRTWRNGGLGAMADLAQWRTCM